MSYSVCLECREMVGGYQKYCSKCEKTKKQSDSYWDFWKTHGYEFYEEPLRTKELKRDSKDPTPYMIMGER